MSDACYTYVDQTTHYDVKWISVKQSLPPYGRAGIVYGVIKHRNVLHQSYEARRHTGIWPISDDPDNWCWLEPCDAVVCDVTHWFCLPKRPEK